MAPSFPGPVTVESGSKTAPVVSTLLRALAAGTGLVVIAVACAHGAVQPLSVQGGAALVLAFLALSSMWLILAGAFGLGRWSLSDAWLGLPVAVGLLLRLVLVRRGISFEGIEFPRWSFAAPNWMYDRHSFTFAAFKALFVELGGASDSHFMVLNGVVDAAVAVPLALFVGRRFDDRLMGFVAALLWATDVLAARLGPTDSHFPLLLFWWYCGLALLSDREATRGAIFAGFVSLGLAGSLRLEGFAYLVLALPLIRWEPILRSSGRLRAACLGFGAAAAASLANLAFCRNDGQHLNLSQNVSEIPGNLVMPAVFFLIWITAFAGRPLVVRALGMGGLLWSANVRLFSGLFSGLFNGFVLAPFMAAALLGDSDGPGLLRLEWAVFAVATIVKGIVGVHGETSSNWYKLVMVSSLDIVLCSAGILLVLRKLFGDHYRRPVIIGGLVATILAIPAARWSSLRAESWYTGEYNLVRNHFSAPDVADRCTLLWFSRSDGELYDPRLAVEGRPFRKRNCALEDCVAALGQDPCQFFLAGNHCLGDPHGRADCANLMARARLSVVEQRRVDTGVVTLYRVLGASREASAQTGAP